MVGASCHGAGEVWNPYHVPRRTLMRPLLVKRQTAPVSGVFLFFSAFRIPVLSVLGLVL
jgi:hypothetical protein